LAEGRLIVGRLIWSQLRFRAVRVIALLAGLLVAATAFTVLTAATRTAQLKTVGTVSSHFVPAYEILVRPAGVRTRLEEQTDTVQPNFLAGIYGGISLAQYREIAGLPGVSVAAPIAMVGYALLAAPVPFTIPAADYRGSSRLLYRYQTTWVSDDGTSRDAQPASYTYVTPSRLRFNDFSGGLQEVVPGHRARTACPYQPESLTASPFGVGDQSIANCWSKVDGTPSGPGPTFNIPAPGYNADWVIPVLIAAIDPAAEAKLDGLNHAVVSGHYLTEHVSTTPHHGESEFPVLASAASGMDEYAITTLQRLASPATPPDMTVRWRERESSVPGHTLVTDRTTAQQAYQLLLGDLASNVQVGDRPPVLGYWSIGPVSYRRSATGVLTPAAVRNPPSIWQTAGSADVSMDNEDNAYRQVLAHTHSGNEYAVGGGGAFATPKLVGTFDPARIRSFSRLSEVPLGGYEPIATAPATAASRRALHGADLLPNQNLGGYVSQPVNLITTLSALPALQNDIQYGPDLPVSDPISVIRVRVGGVTGPNQVSLERIREVAQQIAVRTHLDVDIVAGSSPAPTIVDLPAGKFGQPALTLTQGWVKKGVAVAILSAVDKNSLVLFFLILIVCVLFVANSATAAIRGRRRELGVLACLGWTRPRLFTVVLGELAAIGLTAGVLGAAAALPLSQALGLRASPERAALAVPTAIAVAVIAGLIPAWLAARTDPATSIRPPVLAVRRSRQPGTVTGLAATNVLRTPGRALTGAVGLAVGITALTMLAAVSLTFRGVVVGSLLGNAVAVQVRGVDYIAVAATVLLGVLAVADVVFLNITERAAELAVIRALGWQESALSRLVITEGVIIGLVGSLAGAAIGLGAAATFAGQAPGPLYLVAATAVAGGMLVTAAAAVWPAQALRRLPAAQLLAAD
jgi:putative ABC transport system permease protein